MHDTLTQCIERCVECVADEPQRKNKIKTMTTFNEQSERSAEIKAAVAVVTESLTIYVIVGKYFWGKGWSIEQAKQDAFRNSGLGKCKQKTSTLAAYLGTPDIEVDGYGRVVAMAFVSLGIIQ